jgi:hypothetical protein
VVPAGLKPDRQIIIREFYRDNRNVIMADGATDKHGNFTDPDGLFPTRSAACRTIH